MCTDTHVWSMYGTYIHPFHMAWESYGGHPCPSYPELAWLHVTVPDQSETHAVAVISRRRRKFDLLHPSTMSAASFILPQQPSSQLLYQAGLRHNGPLKGRSLELRHTLGTCQTFYPPLRLPCCPHLASTQWSTSSTSSKQTSSWILRPGNTLQKVIKPSEHRLHVLCNISKSHCARTADMHSGLVKPAAVH